MTRWADGVSLFLQVSPVVHQLDHFQQELVGIADALIQSDASLQYRRSAGKDDTAKAATVDRAWQAVAVSRCLFDCASSVDFTKPAVPTG